MSFLSDLFGKGKKKQELNIPITKLPSAPTDKDGTEVRLPSAQQASPEINNTKPFEAKKIPVWKPGDVILDHYEIEDVITSGGMGRIYIANHRNWKVKIAIKSPTEEMLQDEDFYSRVVKEAEAWTELGLHPNIAYCYFVRNIEDVPHIFVEYVDGGNLKEWIMDGRCADLKTGLDLAIQFCHGMAHAHSKGMIHRDIKPANVLMTQDGTLKVTDFGIAKWGKEEESGKDLIQQGDDTRTIGFIGTKAYASPEQWKDAHNVGPETDIFSFGLCLWEMLCGMKPYTIAYEKVEIPNPRKLRPDLPENLHNLLEQLVAFEKEERQKLRGFEGLRERFKIIYQELFNEPSPHSELEKINLQADGLNNRGVSYLELGKKAEAIASWQEALNTDPTHLETTNNLLLIQWRDGVIADDEVIRRLVNCVNNPLVIKETLHELLAFIYVERFEPEAAQEVLKDYHGKFEKLFHCVRTDSIKCLHTMELSVSTPGHTEDVNSVIIDQDNRMAISGSNDNTIRLWDIETGQSLRSIEGHTGAVNSVVVSHDGRFIVSGSNDNTIRLWDIETGQSLRSIEGHTGAVNSVVVSHDGRFIVSGSNDNTIRLWDIETGQCLQTLEGHTSVVNSVAVTLDSRFALSGSNDKTVRLWELETGRCLRTMEGHRRGVHSVSVTANGWYAVSGGDDDTIRIWELPSGRCLRTLEGHIGSVLSVFLTADGRFALSGGEDTTIRLWEIPLNKSNEALLQLSQSRGFLETKAEQDFLNKTIEQVDALYRKGDNEGAYSMLFKTWKGIAFRKHRTIEQAYRNLKSQGRIKNLVFYDQQTIKDHMGVIYSITAADNGQFALSGGDRVIRFWDLETGRCLRTLEGHVGAVYSVSMTADGEFAVSGGEDKTIRLWNLKTGQCLSIFEDNPCKVYAVCITSDRQLALTGGVDVELRLWDLEAGRCLRTLEGHTNTVNSISMTADGQFALSGSNDKTIRLWNLKTGQCLRIMDANANSVSMTSDGRFAVSGDNNGTIHFWELKTGRCLCSMKGHRMMVNSVSMTTDGRFAISGGGDEKLQLWDLETGQCICTIEGHTNPISSVFINPEGLFALSGGFDKTIRLWRLVWDLDFKPK